MMGPRYLPTTAAHWDFIGRYYLGTYVPLFLPTYVSSIIYLTFTRSWQIIIHITYVPSYLPTYLGILGSLRWHFSANNSEGSTSVWGSLHLSGIIYWFPCVLYAITLTQLERYFLELHFDQLQREHLILCRNNQNLLIPMWNQCSCCYMSVTESEIPRCHY